MAWIVTPSAALIEAVSVPTIWADHICAMSITDGVFTTYYSSIREPLPGRPQEEVLEVIIKRPVLSLLDAIAQGHRALRYLQSPPIGPAPWKPQLVR